MKGLRCPLGYPHSDLCHLRMIARQTGTMPHWPAPGTVRPGARAPSCGSLGSPPPEAGRRIPKRYLGAGGGGGLRAQLFEPRAWAGGAGRSAGPTSRYLPPASAAPGGGRAAARRAAHLPRACMRACVCVRAVMILPRA